MTRRAALFSVCIAVVLAAATGGLFLSKPGAALRAWLAPVSAVGGLFTALGVAAGALHLRFGEAVFFNRVIAG